MLLDGSTFPRRDVIGAWLKRDALRASRRRDPSGPRRRRPRPGIHRRPGAGRAARTRAGPDPRRSPAVAASSRPFCTKGRRPASTSPATDPPPSPIPSSPAPESSTPPSSSPGTAPAPGRGPHRADRPELPAGVDESRRVRGSRSPV